MGEKTNIVFNHTETHQAMLWFHPAFFFSLTPESGMYQIEAALSAWVLEQEDRWTELPEPATHH